MNLTFGTARAQSELFTFQCSQWEFIWNSQQIGRSKEMSPGESYSQLELIWNSQLIGRYKEMPPGESYIWNCQSTEWTLCFSMQSMSTEWTLCFSMRQGAPIRNSQIIGRYNTLSPGESYSQSELIWNSHLIGRYKEMLPGESYIWNCQSTEWTLCFSMRSMSTH